MEDDFDINYEDELEAMRDFDEPESMSPKPRRSLQFVTPKQKGQNVKDAQLLPLKSPMGAMNGSLLRENDVGKRPVVSDTKKRPRDENSQPDSDLEYDDEDLNEPTHVSKRSRKDEQVDEEDLWGDDFDNPPKPQPVKHLYNNKINKYVAPEEEEENQAVSPDKLLIDRIVEYRNQLSVKELKFSSENKSNEREGLVNDYDFERQRVFKRIPSTSYIPATSTSGDRAYMTLKDDLDFEKEFESFNKNVRGAQLLSVPFHVLMEQLEEQRRNFLLAQTERLSEEVNRQLNDEDQGFMDGDDDEEEETDKENRQPVEHVPQEVQKNLWVEKYAPRRYTDLLSDESINRSLLQWLKNWDYVVFDKELPIQNKEKKKEEPKKFVKGKFQPQNQDELDKYNRPTQLISLLCGPPGLGKTTLAHIIAKHAGYNVVEMNASDDRSADVFKTRIEAATQMKAVYGADPRPNCLIIDEIDGAPQAAINVLLGMIKKVEGMEPAKKKKKEDAGLLRRPIICICNDQYVPALRQLRQNAMVLNFPQTEPAKLACRLHEVVRLERLRTDMHTLMALCEKTDNDIRSCLNTLQFIRRQCKEINMTNVQSLAVGQKDSHRSLFNVWHEVFSLPRPKRQKFVNLQESGMKDLVLNTSSGARFRNVLSIVQGAGEYDKLSQGLFENYLQCKFKDPHMDGVTLATEWLCFSDVTNHYIQRVQDYSLMPYLPFLSVTFHFLFASNALQKLQYPHSFSENYLKTTKCENLVSTMMADMAPGTRKFINIPVVVMELLPPMLEIIQPSFRPVNTQLYSTKEKEDLANLVRIMLAYNMTYQQEKSLDGQYNYVLEPHMDEVVRFPGLKQHRQLSYASKQLVAREVQLERMRKSENARMGPIQDNEKAVEAEGSKSGAQAKDKPAVPSHLQRLTAKPLNKEEDVPIKDFFGRIIKKTTPEAKKNTSTEETKNKNILATDIWFHFQGGYTNAVRRDVKIKEFF